MNVFVADWTGPDGWTAVFECPRCGSDNCVKDSEAREHGHDPDPIGNLFEFVENVADEGDGDG